MPTVEIELSKELVEAIDAHKGSLNRSEFIEQGMKSIMKSKLKLNLEEILKKW